MSLNVFITGASSGIGAALAREFARRGATLGLVARRKEALDELIGTLDNSEKHYAYPCDVTDRDHLIAVGREFDQITGGADIVIANAGISVGVKTQYYEDLDVMEKVYATNVFAMASTFHAWYRSVLLKQVCRYHILRELACRNEKIRRARGLSVAWFCKDSSDRRQSLPDAFYSHA